MRPVERAVVVERLPIEIHDLLPVCEQFPACGAAAAVAVLGLRQRSRPQSMKVHDGSPVVERGPRASGLTSSAGNQAQPSGLICETALAPTSKAALDAVSVPAPAAA
jgi:hypothetical protein